MYFFSLVHGLILSGITKKGPCHAQAEIFVIVQGASGIRGFKGSRRCSVILPPRGYKPGVILPVAVPLCRIANASSLFDVRSKAQRAKVKCLEDELQRKDRIIAAVTEEGLELKKNMRLRLLQAINT